MSADSKKKVQERVEALKRQAEEKKKAKAMAAAAKAEEKPAEAKPAEETKPEVKAEAVAPAQPAEAKPAEETKPEVVIPEMPPMPADFCLQDQKYWDEAKESLHDPASNECASCEKTHTDCYKVCVVRHGIIALKLGSAKKSGAKGVRAPVARRSGGITETARINELLLAGAALADIQAKIAGEFYSDDSKRSAARVKGHLRSLKAGTCISARLFTPEQLAAYTV